MDQRVCKWKRVSEADIVSGTLYATLEITHDLLVVELLLVIVVTTPSAYFSLEFLQKIFALNN